MLDNASYLLDILAKTYKKERLSTICLISLVPREAERQSIRFCEKGGSSRILWQTPQLQPNQKTIGGNRMKMWKRLISVVIAAMMVFSLTVPAYAAGSVKLNKTKATIYVGDTLKLKLNNNKKSVKWSSSKKTVAKVSSKGKVTGIKAGKATIKAKVGKKTYTCAVTVKKPSLSKSSVTLSEGKFTTIKLNGGKIKSVKSSNKSVVTVSKSGKLTAKKAGKATVTVTSTKGKKYTCKVTVVKEKMYTVTFQSNGGSSVAAVKVANGKKLTAPQAPTRKGYVFTGWYTDSACTKKYDFAKTAVTKSITLYAGWTKAADLSYDGYTMKWQDEFNGTELNRKDWNVELHEPGWVNAELQAYVDDAENIRVQDGKLILKAHKDENGNITSGRVNTQGKHDYKYGLMEAKVKVPAGKGYLPAFWMMPTDENLYGQWPRCGEIDIMEVMGQDTKKSYGTIHFGNPHSESQGTKVLEKGDFSEEYHTFAVEWEPGLIKWYVDGNLIHQENDWYSTTENQGTVTYPAPFDQPFYVIFNLAVGGSWVGYPDDDAEVEGEFMVDYVRIYQKDSYDENVSAPEKEQAPMREADETGNYILNGDFSQDEDFSDNSGWDLMTQQGGDASAEIVDGALKITTVDAGSVDYSIQVVQTGVPAEKGATYRLTFDAWCDGEDRTAIVNVDAVDRGWSRYLPDTTINLTNEKQTFTFEYSMSGENDPNSRLEFNLGNTAPTSTMYLDNFRLEKIDQKEVTDDKGVLANGNYVYNGKFQEGTGRLAYWDIENAANAVISVTNEDAHDRRLKIVAPEGTSAETPVVVSQDKLAIAPNSAYALSYDADGDAGKTIQATLAGFPMDVTLTGESQTVKLSATTGDTAERKVVFTITEAGTYFIDNVSIVEDSLIKNGSFNADLAGYEPYVDGSASADYVVDSLQEDNAFSTTITNTGDADWKVQLKQSGVKLEEGQWYRLSLDMKSTLDRDVVVAIQRDGNTHNDDWTPYVQSVETLGAEYKTYALEFQMNPATEPKTDTNAVFNVAMGAVNGKQITESHRICIDNIVLEKIDAPAASDYDGGLIQNGDFSLGKNNWGVTVANWDSSVHASAVATTDEGSINFAIEDAGEEDWHVQLKQTGITLEGGKNYTVSLKAKSSVTRSIMVGVQNATNYTYYAGETVDLVAGEEQTITFPVNIAETDDDVAFYVSMGSPINGVEQPASDVTLSYISLK